MTTFTGKNSKEFLDEENRAIKAEVRGSKYIVPFTMINIKKCMCSQCPVQADSDCVQEKFKSTKKAMENVSSEYVLVLKTFREYIAQLAKLSAQALNLTDDAFAIHARSGKSITSKMRIQIITSVNKEEQFNFFW